MVEQIFKNNIHRESFIDPMFVLSFWWDTKLKKSLVLMLKDQTEYWNQISNCKVSVDNV